MDNKYCIKEEYIHRNENYTFDSDDRNFWNSRRLEQHAVTQWYEYSWAKSLIEKFKAKTVLDVGCGPAFKLNRLIAPHVEQFVGIDQKSAIEYAKQTYNAGHYLDVDLDRISDFENEPLLSQKYDFIIHAAVIEHLKEPDQLLSFIKRRMTLASHLLISTCDRDRVRGIHNMMSPKPEHVREWNAHEFYAYMVQSGFKVVKFVYLPPNRLTKDDFWKETNKWMWKGDGRCLFYEMAFLCRLSE